MGTSHWVCYDKINNSDFGCEMNGRFPHFTVEKNENWNLK